MPPYAGSATRVPRAKNAELVAFRVAQNDPCLVALADIDVRGPEANKPFDLGVLIVWAEVKVKPVLARLSLWNRNKQKSRKATFARSYLEFVGRVVDYNPAQRHLPPAAQRFGIFRVDVYLLPVEAHEQSIKGRCVPQCSV
jgi:hypothetical protein